MRWQPSLQHRVSRFLVLQHDMHKFGCDHPLNSWYLRRKGEKEKRRKGEKEKRRKVKTNVKKQLVKSRNIATTYNNTNAGSHNKFFTRTARSVFFPQKYVERTYWQVLNPQQEDRVGRRQTSHVNKLNRTPQGQGFPNGKCVTWQTGCRTFRCRV